MGVARAVVLVALLGGAARADVDWAKGLVTATGIGIADRHAPSPAAAREPARRAAEDAARAKLAAALPAIPVAGNTTLAAKLADPKIRTRATPALERAVAAAITIDATPQTDGSWNVTLAVPIEAIRQAIAGLRTPSASDADPPVVIVDGVTHKPAVGYPIGGVAAATVWLTEVPVWAKGAPHVKAVAGSADAIAVATNAGGPSTLFVLLK